jgi:oligosaccharyltransferase complex subunit epsilon
MAKTESVGSIWSDFRAKYEKTTPKKIKLIDGFLAYVLATGILQFIYCALVGNFPFNSFLSGFVCTVGVFVLAGKWGAIGALESLDARMTRGC